MFESRKKLLKEINDLLDVNERRGEIILKLQKEVERMTSSKDCALKMNTQLKCF